MKSAIAILGFAAGVLAQNLGDLPLCGQTCINNMIRIATAEFGCREGDVACYCNEARFGYGVRDCAEQACNAQQAASVIQYGTEYCAIALQSVSVTPSGTGALPILSSALASATTVNASATASSAVAPITSSSASAISSATESAGSVISSVASSLEGSLTSAISSALESATGTATETGSESPTSTGEPAEGAALRMTAVPILGAAGLAALLLV